jgi:hypothetical protein
VALPWGLRVHRSVQIQKHTRRSRLALNLALSSFNLNCHRLNRQRSRLGSRIGLPMAASDGDRASPALPALLPPADYSLVSLAAARSTTGVLTTGRFSDPNTFSLLLLLKRSTSRALRQPSVGVCVFAHRQSEPFSHSPFFDQLKQGPVTTRSGLTLT